LFKLKKGFRRWKEYQEMKTFVRALRRKDAELKKEVYFVGVLDYIGMWHPANFKKYLESMRQSYESVAGEVLGFQDKR